MLNGNLHNDNGPARITQVWESGNNLAVEKKNIISMVRNTDMNILIIKILD